MLHILLLILKIIGWILLAILGLAVLLICVIFFVPLCYKAEGTCGGDLDSLKGRLRFSWLFRLVGGFVEYDKGKLKWVVRIAWKKIRGDVEEDEEAAEEEETKKEEKATEEEETKEEESASEVIASVHGNHESDHEIDSKTEYEIDHKSDHESDHEIDYESNPKSDDETANGNGAEEFASDVQRLTELLKENEEEMQESSEDDSEDSLEIETEPVQEDSSEIETALVQEDRGLNAPQTVRKVEPLAETEDTHSKRDSTEKKRKTRKERQPSGSDAEKPGFFEKIGAKIQQFFEKLKYTFAKICDTMKSLVEKKEKLTDFITDEAHRSTFFALIKELKRLLRFLKPKHLEADIEFGFDDPYLTGQILAALSMIYPFIGTHVEIQPDFEQKVLKGNLLISGKIRVFYIIIMLWNLIWNKNVRITIKHIRNFKL